MTASALAAPRSLEPARVFSAGWVAPVSAIEALLAVFRSGVKGSGEEAKLLSSLTSLMESVEGVSLEIRSVSLEMRTFANTPGGLRALALAEPFARVDRLLEAGLPRARKLVTDLEALEILEEVWPKQSERLLRGLGSLIEGFEALDEINTEIVVARSERAKVDPVFAAMLSAEIDDEDAPEDFECTKPVYSADELRAALKR